MRTRMQLALCLVALAACDGGARPSRPQAPTVPLPSRDPSASPTPTPPTTVGPPPAFAFPLLPSPEHALAVSVGGSHACLLRRDGALDCWGRNEWGELGDGTTEARSAPVRVSSVPLAAEVSVGAAHTCMRAANGDVWCWGSDELAQIGAGAPSHARAPTRVVTGATSLVASTVATCALGGAPGGRCWGNLPATSDGPQRTLGASATFATPTGLGFALGRGFTNGGSRACALRADGVVLCWGEGVGDSSMVFGPRSGPRTVSHLGHATALSGGDAFTCAAATGAVACWGPHVTMFLGLADAGEWAAAPVDGFGATTLLSAGDRVVCAQGASGPVACAGWGQLVDARGWTVTLGSRAAPIAALGHARSLSMSGSGGCAVGDDDVVRCVVWRSPDWDRPPSPPS